MSLNEYVERMKELQVLLKDLDPELRPAAFAFLLESAFGAARPTEEARPSPEDLFAGKSLSLVEFLAEGLWSSRRAVGLATSYYIEQLEGKESHCADDLTQALKKAKQPLPANPSDVISTNAKLGYLKEHHREGKTIHYTLTRSGIREIERQISEKPEADK